MALLPQLALAAASTDKTPPNLLGMFANAMQLKALADQSRAQQFQLGKMERDEADDMAMRRAIAVGPDGQIDQARTIGNLQQMGQGHRIPALSHQWMTERLAATKAGFDAMESRLKAGIQATDFLARGVLAMPQNAGVGDWQRLRATAAQYGIGDMIPDVTSDDQVPAAREAVLNSALGAKGHFEQQLAQRKQAYEESVPKSEGGKAVLDFRDASAGRGLLGAAMGTGAPAAPATTATVAPTGATVTAPGDVVAPSVNVTAAYDPTEDLANNVARVTQGPAPEGFGYRQGQLVPLTDVQAYHLKRAEKSAPTTNVNMGKVETSARVATNDDFIKNVYRPTQDAADAAGKADMAAEALSKINLKTGWGASAAATAARVLSSLGVADKDIQQYAADAQKFQKFVMDYNWQLLNQAKGVQTEGDAQRAMQTYLSLENTPEANSFIADYMRAVNARAKEKAFMFRKGYKGALDSGDLSELERQWYDSPEAGKSIFDYPTMKKWAQRGGTPAGGNAGGAVRKYNPATGKIE